MHDEPRWIATPHIRADYRGPVDRPYEGISDPLHAAPIIDTLRAVAERLPDHLAIADDALELTYAQMMRASARLSSRIDRLADGPVAVVLPTGVAYAVALYACLMSKRMCVLLDSQFPMARNKAISEQTGASVIALPSQLPSFSGVDAIAIDPDDDMALHSDRGDRVRGSADLDAPAFLLCTSGSSGVPKAIAHSQRTMLHWARTTHDALHVTPSDSVLSLSPLSSLGGFTGLLNYGLAGASIQMIDLKASGIASLLERMVAKRVTILRAAPSMLRSLARLPEARTSLQGLRVVQAYGEPLMKADVAELRDVLPADCFVRTTYGATESSGLTWFAGEPDAHDALRVASGTLMPDTLAAIVDEDGRSCGVGEPGELWIRSRYNALGEWVDGRLVPGRLQPHPDGDGTRVYKTGDIARCSADGVFVVLGRADRMVKINGQRIEPAEVERVLRLASGVERAEVIAVTEGTTTRLVAFVVAAPGAPTDMLPSLRSALRTSLPSYMVPSRIDVVPSIPLLPGGKVDGLALQALARRPA